MDWPATLILGAIAIGLTAACGWAGARPPDLRRGPRMIPYRFLMLLGATATMLLLVHAANLLGLHTGR